VVVEPFRHKCLRENQAFSRGLDRLIAEPQPRHLLEERDRPIRQQSAIAVGEPVQRRASRRQLLDLCGELLLDVREPGGELGILRIEQGATSASGTPAAASVRTCTKRSRSSALYRR
jgi:hypothetical protein